MPGLDIFMYRLSLLNIFNHLWFSYCLWVYPYTLGYFSHAILNTNRVEYSLAPPFLVLFIVWHLNNVENRLGNMVVCRPRSYGWGLVEERFHPRLLVSKRVCGWNGFQSLLFIPFGCLVWS
jgi:hypothetical protein